MCLRAPWKTTADVHVDGIVDAPVAELSPNQRSRESFMRTTHCTVRGSTTACGMIGTLSNVTSVLVNSEHAPGAYPRIIEISLHNQ